MKQEYRAITPEQGSSAKENYILPQVGLRTEEATMHRPDSACFGPDAFPVNLPAAGPFEPQYGWGSLSEPADGLTPEQALTDIQSNPELHTTKNEQFARNQIALAAFGRGPSGCGATAEDAGNVDRGGWIDYKPVPFAGC